MVKYLLLLVLIFIGTAGQILLKTTANQLVPTLPEINSFGTLMQTIFIFLKNYKILSVILLYAAGFFLWFLTLTKFELNYAFPLMIAAVYGLVLFFSWMFLKESVTTLKILGILIIAVGIILIAKS
ncbi:MAG: hypothetical protein ABIB55_01215 [Candidatus Nealsonbacteria bacterium]